jgi:hypothetical protein
VSNEKKKERPKLKVHEWFWALLPIGLVAVGGAIGGMLGGAAAAWNIKIFGSERTLGRKYAYSTLISVGALISYILAASAFVLYVQGG